MQSKQILDLTATGRALAIAKYLQAPSQYPVAIAIEEGGNYWGSDRENSSDCDRCHIRNY